MESRPLASWWRRSIEGGSGSSDVSGGIWAPASHSMAWVNLRVRAAVRSKASFLLGAAPLPWVALVVVQAFDGLAPVAVVWAIEHVVAAAVSGAATPQNSATLAITLAAIVLMLGKALGATTGMLQLVVTNRVAAEIDSRLLEYTLSLPGLAPLEEAAFADRVQQLAWARDVQRVASGVGYLVRWTVTAASCLLVLWKVGALPVTAMLLAELPSMLLHWKHAEAQKAIQRSGTKWWRMAGYQHNLATEQRGSREVRLCSAEEWLIAGEKRAWRQASEPMLASLRSQLGHLTIAAPLKLSAVGWTFAAAYGGLASERLDASQFTGILLALATFSAAVYWVETFPAMLRDSTRFLAVAVELPPRSLQRRGSRAATSRAAKGPSIRFDGVGFTYPGASRATLSNFNLTIPGGSLVVLVGRNGAGKSTLIKLLCRFYEPTLGRIRVDNVDINGLELDDWRGQLSVMQQCRTRFPASLHENALPGDNGVVPGELEAAALITGFDRVVAERQHGWSTLAGREFGGEELSGGEWQRLALTRAILRTRVRHTPILVLDEPMASLDHLAKVRLQAHLRRRSRNETTLVVSHDLTLARIADVVAVVDRGTVVEVGSHEGLVRAGGLYSRMARDAGND